MENAQVFRAVVEHHNTVRPHSALGYRPPAPEVRACAAATIGAKLSSFPELTFGVDQSVGQATPAQPEKVW